MSYFSAKRSNPYEETFRIGETKRRAVETDEKIYTRYKRIFNDGYKQDFIR